MKKFIIFILMIGSFYAYSQNIPSPTGYVNDFAEIITDSDESNLSHMIYNYHNQTSIEMAVVTVNNLDGDIIESYSKELYNAWGIGSASLNDGILVFLSIDPNDKGIRIEYGNGLTLFLNNSKNTKIIEKYIVELNVQNYGKFLIGIVADIQETVGYKTQEERIQFIKSETLKSESEYYNRIKTFYTGLLIVLVILFAILIIYIIKKYRQNKLKKKDTM